MDSLYHDIRLPGRTISGNLFLAPIAGFSDAAFRSICISYGASLGFTEMVSCAGLIRNGEKTFQLLKKAENESFYAVQIFTGDPDIAFQAASIVSELKPDLIDLNCGCPVPKVTKSGAGAALMEDLEKLADIVSAIKEGSSAGKTQKPNLSIKIRSGINNENINFLEVAEKAIAAGAEMISIHPRTRKQGYSGKAKHEYSKMLKDSVEVPVLASGDIFTAMDAKNILEKTGCDGLLFSRGSFGNPWIFKQSIELLTKGETSLEISENEKRETAIKHLLLTASLKGDIRACKEMKKQLCSYTKGSKCASSLRNQIVNASTVEEYIDIFTKAFSGTN